MSGRGAAAALGAALTALAPGCARPAAPPAPAEPAVLSVDPALAAVRDRFEADRERLRVVLFPSPT